MKTTDLRKFMFAGLLLIAFFYVSAAKGKGDSPKFCYDNQGAKVLAESQTVYVYDESGLYLKPHVKYFFEYDANDRVIEKKALRWDANKGDWVNAYLYKYSYGVNAFEVEFAKWDRKKGDYEDFSERVIYCDEADMLTSCTYYRKDSSGENWYLDYRHLVSVPAKTLWNEDILIAVTEK